MLRDKIIVPTPSIPRSKLIAECRRQREVYWVVISTFALFWAGIAALGAPFYGGTDVYVYRDAGCNLAMGHGFTALGMPGASDLASHLFGSDGPGLPFIFGLYAMVFGCNAYSDTYFDLAVALGATVAVAALLERRVQQGLGLYVAVLIGSVLPTGLLFSVNDRPDVAGFALFICACLLATSPQKTLALVAAPMIAGIDTLVFPFGGALAGLAVWALSATRMEGTSSRFPGCTKLVALAIRLFLVYMVPICFVIAIYGALDPTAWRRFIANGFGHGGGLGAAFHNSYSSLLYLAALSSGPYSISLVGSSALTAGIVLIFVTKHLWRGGDWRDFLFAMTLVFFIGAPLFLFPKENNYLAWARSGLFILLMASQTPLAIATQRRHVTGVIFVIIVIANVPFVSLGALRQIQSKASYEIAARQAIVFADAAGALKTDKLLVVPDPYYFLYKPYFWRVADPVYVTGVARPADIIGYVSCDALGSNIRRDNFLPTNVRLFSHARIHYVPNLFGISLSHHEWGWACDDYLMK